MGEDLYWAEKNNDTIRSERANKFEIIHFVGKH